MYCVILCLFCENDDIDEQEKVAEDEYLWSLQMGEAYKRNSLVYM